MTGFNGWMLRLEEKGGNKLGMAIEFINKIYAIELGFCENIGFCNQKCRHQPGF
ncbi:hypothetical protein QUA56_09415 [Microcoleus sp. N3A4]|uniref:hypothetical protein n=1 Tax=Microcoleus sp. N3A4 TaxID=3055379 RepID=UPI002FD1304F